MFESLDISTSVTTFFDNYNTLLAEHKRFPKEFSLQPYICVVPGMGVTLMVDFTWNSPESDESRVWLDRTSKLATPLVNPQSAAQKTTIREHSAMIMDMLPKQPLSRSQSISVSHFSKETIAGLARVCANIPRNSVGGINIHIIREDSPACSTDVPDSVCPYRFPHVMIEVLGMSNDETSLDEAGAWALDSRKEMLGVDAALETSYLALTSPEFADLEKIYGTKLEELKKLKRVYDPNNFFKYTVPRIV